MSRFNYFFGRLGIREKLTILLLFITLSPLLIIGYYGYTSATQSLIKNVLTHDKVEVIALADKLQDSLNNIPYDLKVMESFYALQRYLAWRDIGDPYKTTEYWKNIQSSFISLIKNKPLYHKIQILDAKGEELIVLEKNRLSQMVNNISSHDLKDKKDENYFLETLKLSEGEIYFQEIYIEQQEHDAFPALRYATPIVDGNKETKGVIVLTFYANILLEIIKRQADKKSFDKDYFKYILVNQSGQYLYHHNESKQFHYALHPQEASMAGDMPELFKKISQQTSGVLKNDNLISTFYTIYPTKTQDIAWILIKKTDADLALRSVQNFKYLFIISFILVFVITLIVANRFTAALIHPLINVKNELKRLSQGKMTEDQFNYHNNDEILEIITSIRQLKDSFYSIIQQANSIAQGDYSREVILLSTEDQLGRALYNMTQTLKTVSEKNQQQNWLKTGQNQLNEKMSGELKVQVLAHNILSFIISYLNAHLGVFYIVESSEENAENIKLKLIASYGYQKRRQLSNEFLLGEGLVGQAALERQSILITDLPPTYIHIQSGLGESVPANVLVVPLIFEDSLKGVVEIGSLHALSELQQTFISQVSHAIALAINTAESRAKMQVLLEQTQTQTEELQTQTEELQTQAEELQTQQEELHQTNEELETKTQDLERQKEEIRQKNADLEKTKQEIEQKAKELEIASKYKSEFLANMSHELRTPLNSMLILAQMLAENRGQNLTEKQTEYAQTIYSAGSDLLTLINDILDLSKVEAGKIELYPEEIELQKFVDSIQTKFQHIADNKVLQFTIEIDEKTPATLYTDNQRLRQIVTNLLSNAFKFTDKGGVTLKIAPATPNEFLTKNQLVAEELLVFQVEDTGIGIAEDKQLLIFEAFQQAEGGTSRRYGGTGLGLSISRQLAKLLKGKIQLSSQPGKGSTFTLYLPLKYPATSPTTTNTPDESPSLFSRKPSATAIEPATSIKTGEEDQESLSPPSMEKTEKSLIPATNPLPLDDRDKLLPQDRFILIIEDDRNFSGVFMEIAREKDFKCLLAEDGKTGLQLATDYQPHAIILDIGLPKIDGWTVMEQLKENAQTRHIPVHFVSAADHRNDAKQLGAIGYLLKPVNMEELGQALSKIEQFINKQLKNVLIVSNQSQNQKIVETIGGAEDTAVKTVSSSGAAIDELAIMDYDCIVLDLNQQNPEALNLLAKLVDNEHYAEIPIIIYSDRELSEEEQQQLQKFEEHLTIKSVRSPERLLDETTLFLHQLESKLPQEKRKILQMIHDKASLLKGKKVLVVDDDMRNTFALATALEDREMEVIVAKNGRQALTILQQQPDIDIILMDVMMPEMDGYEAMRKIRVQDAFKKLPIIALTAKAMKGDKAKCIEAGANDYLSKPVDTNKLISLMRVWLYQ